jgi:hypothetical protein
MLETFENVGPATDPTVTTLSHEKVEHLVRSLAVIPGGRPLIAVLPEGLAWRAHSAAALPFGTQPPQPPSDLGSDGSSHRGRAPDEQSQGHAAPLDNTFPGGRYNNRELADYTKALRNSAPIQLLRLLSNGDYKAWKSELPLHAWRHHVRRLALRRGERTPQTEVHPVLHGAQGHGVLSARAVAVGGPTNHVQDQRAQ